MSTTLGGHPCQAILLLNNTIAASALGTAAATVIGTISTQYVRSWNAYNLTLRNLEVIFGPEGGTAAIGVFLPGNTTVNGAMAGPAVRNPLAVTQGVVVRVRTTENTPVTIASTTPLVLNFWA